MLGLPLHTAGDGSGNLGVLKDFTEEQVSLFGRLGSLPLYFFMYAFLRPVVIIDHVVNEGGGAASRSVLNNGGSSLNYELRQSQSV